MHVPGVHSSGIQMRPHQYSDYVVLVDPACLMASQQEYPTPALQTLHIYGNGESSQA